MQYVETSSHLEKILHPNQRQDTIQWIVDVLKPHVDKFDAIVVCGASGMLLSSVADLLHKNIILVRKSSDDTHSTVPVEGPRDGRYIILDDLIDTGHTIQWVYDTMFSFNQYATCIGIVLYHLQHHRIDVEGISRDSLPGPVNNNYNGYLMTNSTGEIVETCSLEEIDAENGAYA